MSKEIKFPIYKKLKNGKAVYWIRSPVKMTELQLVGSRIIRHELHATILPERVLMSDLISNEGDRWVLIPESEYRSWENKLGK